jgi:hypothetical protein
MPSDEGGMSYPLPRALATLAVSLCLLAPGCGGDSEPDRFSSGYNAAIQRLDQASRKVIAVEPARKKESSRAIARQLDRFADVLEDTRQDLARLEPPDRAAKEFKGLVAALDKSVSAGHKAAAAARAIQPKRQRRALDELREAALEIAHAQTALSRAVEGSSG